MLIMKRLSKNDRKCDYLRTLNKVNDYDPDEYWCIKKQKFIYVCSRCRNFINKQGDRKDKLDNISKNI